MAGWARAAVLVLALLLVGKGAALPVRRQEVDDPFRPGCVTAGAPRDGDGVINVHIVSHSHDDVGWLKTVDQYFYGANQSIQHAGVQYILDTVVAQCMINPDRKFTYVEMAFFQRWWNEQTPHMRDVVRGLVASQQLQFINGGWSMHDEACTHYVSMIENTGLGHRFLKEELDYIPRVGWQIDPFGHSATQAALLSAEVGFDALYFARIDWQESKVRTAAKSMEMVWRASESLGPAAEVFTGAFLDGGYGPPPGFDFDGMPVMDDECMADENSQAYVEKFVAAALRYAGNTRGETGTKNVMFLMGSDFQYENADMWFNNLDKIIHHVNADGRVNAFYSTPPEYTRAKYRENRTWAVKTDDFMPLADSKNSYWTGFYASRPCLKRYERVQAGYLQAARQIQLLANLKVDKHVKQQLRDGKPWYRFWHGIDRHDMDPLAAAVSLNQHHDAVSGTEMQHVAYDYAMRLAAGGAVADMAALDGLRALSGLPVTEPLVFCKLLNESVCLPSSTSDGFHVLIYNPLSSSRLHIQRIPLSPPSASDGLAWEVSENGVEGGVESASLPSAVVPSTATAGPLQLLQNAKDASALEIVFEASLQPFTLHTFTVRKRTSPQESVTNAPQPSGTVHTPSSSHESGRGPVPGAWFDATVAREKGSPAGSHSPAGHDTRAPRKTKTLPVHARVQAEKGKIVEIGNGRVRVGFDAVTGLLASLVREDEGIAISLSHNFFWYEPAQSPNEQASGAYIFRPNASNTARDGSNARCVGGGGCHAKLSILRTPLVEEAVQVFGDWVTQTVRVYANSGEVEIEWTVGSIPIEDCLGKEVVSRFTTNISSGSEFLTDSNGREMLKRRRCQTADPNLPDAHCRPSVPQYTVTEPIAGNYYPINSQIMIQDKVAALAILVDRAQGGASLRSGQLELMVHRRLVVDDNRGVAEPLNETQSISPYDWVSPDGKVHHVPYRIGTGLVARGKHVLSLTPPATAARAYRSLQDKIYYQAVVAIGQLPKDTKHASTFWDLFTFRAKPSNEENASAKGPSKSTRKGPPVSSRGGPAAGRGPGAGLRASGLRAGVLPENVMILTVEKQLDDAQGGFGVLLRVAHRFGLGEDEELSRPATVALSQLFTAAHLAAPKSVEEMSLSANQRREDMEESRLRFPTEGKEPVVLRGEGRPEGADMAIVLTPLQIRTFILHY